MILSTLTFTEIEFPAVDLTNAGISRLIDCQLVSGLIATSLAAPAIVFRSRIMLRPLVSVPPSAGKRASSREVSPTCWATSDSSLVLSARAEVAGPAAVIRSVMVWFLASSWSARVDNCVNAAEIWSDRASSVPSSSLDLRIRSPKAWPWSPVALRSR